MDHNERLFGAHESVSGGLHTACERISSVGGTALQIFTRNQRQWTAQPVSPQEAQAFAQAWRQWGPYPIASHASYLINLASVNEELREKSVRALAQEMERCRTLGIAWIVLHPGSRGEAPLEDALERVAHSLDQAFALAAPHTPDRPNEPKPPASNAETTGRPAQDPVILLENTAGQGSVLGSDVSHLAKIIENCRCSGHLGLCLDTCHAFAAGYDLRNASGLDALLGAMDMARLKMVHVNDCKGALGSRLDRHEHIGQGQIGLESFRGIVNHPELAALPMVLETHKEKDLKEDVMNLDVLRKLAGQGDSL